MRSPCKSLLIPADVASTPQAPELPVDRAYLESKGFTIVGVESEQIVVLGLVGQVERQLNVDLTQQDPHIAPDLLNRLVTHQRLSIASPLGRSWSTRNIEYRVRNRSLASDR